MRRAAKVDATQKDIVDALRKAGAQVWVIKQPVDLLVYFRGRWQPMEAKTGRGKKLAVYRDKRQEAQSEFLDSTGCPIVRTPEEALRALGAIS
jgi:hypothetical protein